MICNTILKAITNRMPPKCFNCCCWWCGHREVRGYCWLLERNTDMFDKPKDCPLVVETCEYCGGHGQIILSGKLTKCPCKEK